MPNTNTDMTFYELREMVMKSDDGFRTRQQIWHTYLSGITNGTCLEFGVWTGHSINYMADVRPFASFHGFDSFDGLPEAWRANRPAGHFKTDLSKLKFRDNVTIHVGWFDKTLPPYASSHSGRCEGIHIDCDLGSSTSTVLNLLSNIILKDKPLILFDEFYNYRGYEDHEFKAFLDWTNATNANFDVVCRNSVHQQVLIQIK